MKWRQLAAILAFPACAPLLAADLPALFSIADGPTRAAELTRELLPAAPELRAEWVRRIDAAPACAARDEDRLQAVEWWAMADPHVARSYVERATGSAAQRTALLDAFVRGWARVAPADAWAWSKQQPPNESADFPRTVLQVLAETDPAGGLRRLQEETRERGADHGPGSAHEERTIAFFRALIDLGDYAAVRSLVEDYPAGEVRNQVLYFAGDRMSAYAWDETARWARSRASLPDAYYALVAVAVQRVDRDPSAALDWAKREEELGLRARLIRAVAGEIVTRDGTLAAADRVLARLTLPRERQAAHAAFAATAALVHAAPERILDAAWTIEVDEDRRVALLRGYANWVEFARADALKHLEKSGRDHPDDVAAVKTFLAGPGGDR
jgi:hypothetical protein